MNLWEVRAAKVSVPLLLGGGATSENVAQAHADGVIVSTAFKPAGGWRVNRSQRIGMPRGSKSLWRW